MSASTAAPASPSARSAVFPEESLPPAWQRYTEVNALWSRDRTAARRLVDELRPEGG